MILACMLQGLIQEDVLSKGGTAAAKGGSRE